MPVLAEKAVRPAEGTHPATYYPLSPVGCAGRQPYPRSRDASVTKMAACFVVLNSACGTV